MTIYCLLHTSHLLFTTYITSALFRPITTTFCSYSLREHYERLTLFFCNESIATSHVFRLPNNTAYAVRWIAGHQHVGGYGVKLLNVTGIERLDPEGDELNSTTPPYKDAPVVCGSLPRYGTGEPGSVGDEQGFIVETSECVFDEPLLFLPGQAYVVQSTYGADVQNFAPAKFPSPYEGVMGYIIMAFTIPAGYEPGVFSQSGERVLGGDGDEKKDDGFGTCVTSTESSLKTRPALQFSLSLRTRPRRRRNLTSRMLSTSAMPIPIPFRYRKRKQSPRRRQTPTPNSKWPGSFRSPPTPYKSNAPRLIPVTRACANSLRESANSRNPWLVPPGSRSASTASAEEACPARIWSWSSQATAA